ncbi:kinase-like domain-containing protein [Mycena olivaceomarginata]|nr:kinase-like domain-containing protein [Mycena olivaceomarginata]
MLPYVAKRCYKIGRGQVSITENRDELVKEGITLGRSKFFLKNFQSTCEEEEMDISEFEVTDFILAREGITGESNEGSEKTRFIPSPASGITDSAYSGLSDGEKEEFVVINNVISSITWLLEPERGNVQFRKYSGTLEHPRYSDKQGATINAFQHLVYLNSNKSLVLADIQTSKSHNSASKASVLFDLISHTLTGNSGGGDHGEDGIKTFVDQHECGQRCAQMGLEPLTEPKEDE